MRYLLRTEELGSEWFLDDALNWVAFRIYPTDPYEEWIGERPLRVLERFNSMKLAEKLGARPNRNLPDQLDHEFTEKLEPARAELYLQLHRGVIAGSGIWVQRVKKGVGANGWMEDANLLDRFGKEPEQIPANQWRLDHIDWHEAEAIGPHGRYSYIRIPCDQLFACFPEPPLESFEVQYRGGTLLLEDAASSPNLNGRRPGRPPRYKWNAFLQQVAVIAATEGLPDKQDALVAQMMEWCEQNWRVQPASSTIKEKLQPIYAALKKANNS